MPGCGRKSGGAFDRFSVSCHSSVGCRCPALGQVVERGCRRSRRLDAFGGLRGRSGLPPSGGARGRRLHPGAVGGSHRIDRCTDRAAAALRQGPRRSARWWARFKSPALNALIERALDNNPTLQSAIATLRAAREQVYAQEGKFFPLVQANFNPTYQRTSTALTPIPASGANIFALHTAQVEVSYTLDVWVSIAAPSSR